MDAVLATADAARRRVWALSARTRIGRACVRDRSLRLTVLAAGHMAVTFALAGVAPLWLLLLGPILLGVPHVAADLRFLVLRPPAGLVRRAIVALLVPLAAITLLRVIGIATGAHDLAFEHVLGLTAVAGAVLLSPGTARRKALLLALVAAAAVPMVATPGPALVVLAHAHNVVAFALWLYLARRDGPGRRAVLIGLLYVAAIAAILLGALDPGPDAALSAGGLGLAHLTDTLAPGVAGPLGYRVVIAFAFAQAVHYVVWLRLIPQSLDPRPAPPSFRRTISRWCGDLRPLGVVLVLALTALIPALALVDPPAARDTYLHLVAFHAWLELAVLAALLSVRRA